MRGHGPPTGSQLARCRLAAWLLVTALLLCGNTSRADIISETIYFLAPDGRDYLLERALRTDADSHRFFVDKTVQQDDLRHVSPVAFRWDSESDDHANVMHFDAGGFTVIYPGTLGPPELETTADGSLVFRSWTGPTDADGRYGFWYAPGDFDAFIYTWIFPDNIDVIAYRSNREGSWVKRDRSISFFAQAVNNLTFEIRYRVNAPSRAIPVVTTTSPAPPEAPDSDHRGCRLDCDNDGVSNRRDRCPGSAPGAAVDATGCAVKTAADADSDGVNDRRDLCPDSPVGARVDRAGCSLDTDEDGVADGVDRCPATPEGTAVAGDGCPHAGG